MNTYLFDPIREDYLLPKQFKEDNWTYLNRSTREGYGYLRNLLELWFDSYDTSIESRRRFVKRFRSKKSQEHLSAFFELFIYTLLKNADFIVRIEPEIDGKYPDFLVEAKSGEKFVLEATSIYPREGIGGQNTPSSILFDYLNNHLNSPYFFISIDEIETTPTIPSLSNVCKNIQKWIDGLDYEEELARVFQHKTNSPESVHTVDLPQWSPKGIDWKLRLTAQPKTREAFPRRPHSRVIGSINFGVSVLNPTDQIISALKKKSSKYEGISLPYVVAINPIGLEADETDIFDALFGQHVGIIDGTGQYRNSRLYNGAWRGPHGFQKTTVSGVWFFDGLSSTSIAQRDEPILWHHPAAKFPLPTACFPFAQQIPNQDTNSYSFDAGASVSQFIQLDETQLPR